MTAALLLAVVRLAVMSMPAAPDVRPPSFEACWSSPEQAACDQAPDHFASPACRAVRRCFDGNPNWRARRSK